MLGFILFLFVSAGLIAAGYWIGGAFRQVSVNPPQGNVIPAPQRNDDTARESVTDLARDLTSRWVNGSPPSQGLEAMTPELRELLGGENAAIEDVSFENYRHRDYLRADWGFIPFHLEKFFDAPWQFYMPASWRLEPEEEGMGATAYTAEGKKALAIQATHEMRIPADLEWVFGSGDLLGFEYDVDSEDTLHWRFVTHGEHGYHVFGIYAMADVGVLTIGWATNADELTLQLESSMTSIPWYHWMPSDDSEK